jgi:hypothetical protein
VIRNTPTSELFDALSSSRKSVGAASVNMSYVILNLVRFAHNWGVRVMRLVEFYLFLDT